VGSGLWAIPDTSDTRWQALRGPVCVGVGLVQRQGVPSIASTTSVGLVVVATGSALVDSAWQSAVGSGAVKQREATGVRGIAEVTVVRGATTLAIR
jgi:hypothetical protein